VVGKASGKLEAIHQIESIGEVLAPVTNGKRVAYPVSTYVEVFELDGKPVRKIQIDSAVQSPATLSDRLGFIAVSGENGGRMRAVDPSRKYDTPYWELMVFGTVMSAPVFFDQALFFATNTGRVYAVNEEKQPIWPIDNRFFQAGPVQADLTADEYGLYVASTDTKLTCINRSTGRVRWEYFAGEPLYTKPMATAETVYISVRNTGLAAINKTEGDRIRQAKWVSRESTTFLAEDAKYAYVRLRGNALGALDRSTGAVAFRSAPSDLDFFVPNTGKDALIFAATKSGQIMAIRPVTKPGTVGELMFTTPGK
jgi:outer membrane protein assembly factor BamB